MHYFLKEKLNRAMRTEETISSGPVRSGFELIITKGLIELHRGTLSVESKLGVGSKFTFAIPLKKSKKMNNKILVIDDESETEVAEN